MIDITKVAINGLGRIGRCTLRAIYGGVTDCRARMKTIFRARAPDGFL
ncbi:MAG: hypothetical protein LBT71_10220 [Azoarcus sp.]|nr:hypothetical protein [Azoarcus sp.]